MTSIKVSSSYEELELIESLSKEMLRDNGISVKTQISELRTDSIETEIVLPVLSVTFSGIIAVAQVVNLILNVQERRNKTIVQKDIPVYIQIETSNGKKLDLNISGNMTNKEIKKHLNSVQHFVDDFLQNDDGTPLKDSQPGEPVGTTDIDKINLLFTGLLSNLTNIRKFQSLPPREDGERMIFEPTFDKTSLSEFIYGSREEKIYLHCEEAKSCRGFFSTLEKENILAFHEVSTDFHIVDMENIFVRYEIEELALFKKLIYRKNFILNSTFSL
ncbi:MAG: hypothetical protein WBA43_10545 [Elainellaceae cyanobacterium]